MFLWTTCTIIDLKMALLIYKYSLASLELNSWFKRNSFAATNGPKQAMNNDSNRHIDARPKASSKTEHQNSYTASVCSTLPAEPLIPLPQTPRISISTGARLHPLVE